MQAAIAAQIAVQHVFNLGIALTLACVQRQHAADCVLWQWHHVYNKPPQARPNLAGAPYMSCSAPAAEQCTASDPNGVGTVDRSKLKQILTAPRMGLDQRQVSRALQVNHEHAVGSGLCLCALYTHALQCSEWPVRATAMASLQADVASAGSLSGG